MRSAGSPVPITYVADFVPAAPMIGRCFWNDALTRRLRARGSGNASTRGAIRVHTAYEAPLIG